MLLCFRFKLKQRNWPRTDENRFQWKKKVRTLPFWTKTGKNFYWSGKQLQLAWLSCKLAKTSFGAKKTLKQRHLATK